MATFFVGLDEDSPSLFRFAMIAVNRADMIFHWQRNEVGDSGDVEVGCRPIFFLVPWPVGGGRKKVWPVFNRKAV